MTVMTGMIEICDGCRESYKLKDLFMEYIPVTDPSFPVPFEMKLWCQKCQEDREHPN